MDEAAPGSLRATPAWWSFLRLARPVQWSKSVFVLVGPLYGLRDLPPEARTSTRLIDLAISVALAAAAFALVSSACYVVNDLFDRVSDQAHPRKRSRPIACGQVGPGLAWAYAAGLTLAAAALVTVLEARGEGRWVALALTVYALNVLLYSVWLKHVLIADVMCLALGFVLRVLGGCAAAAVQPSTWLLNVTLFLSMFLAFGKRLGERRTLGEAAVHRRVQAGYTDALLQMAVVVTAVSTLLTYASYIQATETLVIGFNLMWLTMLPAFYGLFRAIVLVEQGRYDDPTELAVHDRPFQTAGIVFVAITAVALGRG
jgi:4-hydroxybenzoate polyprenyltransferase